MSDRVSEDDLHYAAAVDTVHEMSMSTHRAMARELIARRDSDLTSGDIDAMQYARHAVGYLFHHEPKGRERALDALTAISKIMSAHGVKP